MSQLSESQRLRAEQNRLNALQIQQRKLLAAQGGSGAPHPTPGPSKPTSGASNITPGRPYSTTESLKFIPPPPKPPSGTPVRSTVSPQGGVAATQFYPPHGSTSSLSAVRPGGVVSGPPAKNPRIDTTKKTSTLPPNVAKKIEENKRRAKEKLEANKRARGIGASGSSVPVAPKIFPQSKVFQQSTTSRSNKVTITFTLNSTTTFQVKMSRYHDGTIQVIKLMASRKYDMATRIWSFQMDDHNRLAEALRKLRPEVEVLAIPPFVLKALEASKRKLPAEYIDLFGLDARLLDALMPFQVEGVKFGINLGGRVLLADDMGLGKTIQALGIACHYRSEWPLLVVTPSSMRYSWEESIVRWVSSVSGEDVVVMSSGGNCFQDASVVVTSYDLLSRKADKMLQHNFGVVIFDESHMIKSYKSARYKAAAPLMKKMKRVIMLSGTPAMSRPMELYTQISGIDPSLFPHFQDYGVRYCEGKKEAWGWAFRGSSNTTELQIILQSCVWIRRMKSDVLSQLPPKQRMTVVLDPDLIKTKKKTFAEMSREVNIQNLTSLQVSGDLLQLFVKTAEAKIPAVREYLKEVLDSGRKFLVFAHHKVMIDNLCSLCNDNRTKYIRIDGRTSAEERMANVSKFQNQDDVQVAVLSITAANTGITLTAAQLVIFAELYWNPGVLVQAEDRVHRIGQKDSVMVQYLIARKTADDQIWPLIQNKLEVLGKVGLSDDKLSSSEMSYQKSACQPDITKFLLADGTSKNTSPKKFAAVPNGIRNIPQSQDTTENTDPNWNS